MRSDARRNEKVQGGRAMAHECTEEDIGEDKVALREEVWRGRLRDIDVS